VSSAPKTGSRSPCREHRRQRRCSKQTDWPLWAHLHARECGPGGAAAAAAPTVARAACWEGRGAAHQAGRAPRGQSARLWPYRHAPDSGRDSGSPLRQARARTSARRAARRPRRPQARPAWPRGRARSRCTERSLRLAAASQRPSMPSRRRPRTAQVPPARARPLTVCAGMEDEPQRAGWNQPCCAAADRLPPAGSHAAQRVSAPVVS